jgi:amidase
LPPIGDVTRPGKQRLKIAVLTRSVDREASPEVRDLTLKAAGLLEELGHRIEHVETPPVAASFGDDFVLFWGMLALAQVRTARLMFGQSFDRTRLDNLTLGLAQHATRNLHRLPAAIVRLRAARRRSATFFASYDAALTPTVADESPRVGYLDPADYQQVLERLSSWVAFTPMQNVTGEPAISLPLAQTAAGLPVGMMLSTTIGAEARLLELAYELEEARPWARIQDSR